MEVTNDTRGRSLEKIATKVDKLPLGALQDSYLEKIAKHAHDHSFKEWFKNLSEQRIFLMHKFFQEFPMEKLDGNEEAKIRLKQRDEILGEGRDVSRRGHEHALSLRKVHPTKFRHYLAFFVEVRKKGGGASEESN